MSRRALTVAGVVGAAALGWVAWRWGGPWLAQAMDLLRRALEAEGSTGLLVGTTLVLPVVGAPLSFFLVLAGAKFGAWGGLAFLAAVIPCHLAAIHLLAAKVARRAVATVLSRTLWSLPAVSRTNARFFTLMVALFPGVSYTLKNYLLVLADTPPRYYYWLGWPCHFLLGAPFVILGGSVRDMDFTLFAIAVAVLILLSVLTHRLARRYSAGKTDTGDDAHG